MLWAGMRSAPSLQGYVRIGALNRCWGCCPAENRLCKELAQRPAIDQTWNVLSVVRRTGFCVKPRVLLHVSMDFIYCYCVHCELNPFGIGAVC